MDGNKKEKETTSPSTTIVVALIGALATIIVALITTFKEPLTSLLFPTSTPATTVAILSTPSPAQTQATVKLTQVSVDAVPALSTPLQDVRIRQAIAYCTDRYSLAASVFPDLDSLQVYSLMMDSFLPKTHWAYSQPSTQYPFNPVQGQALLAQAGWGQYNSDTFRINSNGEELSFQLTTTPAEFRKTWTTLFQSQMQACGIHITILTVDPNWLFGTDTGATKRDFQLGAWYYDYEENPATKNLFSCETIPSQLNGWQGGNLTGWCNQTASDAAVKAIDPLLSQDQRKIYYAIVQEEFAKDIPILPLFWRSDVNGWEHIEFNLSR